MTFPTNARVAAGSAAVADNSGVGNLQTIGGMDDGTTWNDYDGDVIARVQFFFTE